MSAELIVKMWHLYLQDIFYEKEPVQFLSVTHNYGGFKKSLASDMIIYVSMNFCRIKSFYTIPSLRSIPQ